MISKNSGQLKLSNPKLQILLFGMGNDNYEDVKRRQMHAKSK